VDFVLHLGFAMIEPPIPVDEVARLNTLRSLNILDTMPEERFDRLTRMARRMFDVPIALISLVDANRQWFKSCQGLSVSETSREISFCGHAILGDEILTVPDALADERFHDNPLVLGEPKIRFYAGCPLWVNGRKLGTLCLIDRQPRDFDADDRSLLRDLARMAEQEIAAVELATIDELTQMSNRRGFLALGQHALGLCARLQRPASLFYFDLDGFKSINDRFGHAEGDHALVDFSTLLMQTFRESDVVGRLGGDEFVVLLTNCSERESEHALQRLEQAVQQRNQQRARCCDIHFSVGAVAFDDSRHQSIQALLADADALMYERKRSKKGCLKAAWLIA
jgi:diguanylate cyclase (GGDEF)-like protein